MGGNASSQKADFNALENLRQQMADHYEKYTDLHNDHLIKLSLELDQMVIDYMKNHILSSDKKQP